MVKRTLMLSVAACAAIGFAFAGDAQLERGKLELLVEQAGEQELAKAIREWEAFAIQVRGK